MRPARGHRGIDLKGIFVQNLPTMLRRTCYLLAALALAMGLSNCANVKAYQRGYLAEYVMLPNKDPLAKGLADHMYFSREAAYGGEGVGGGGCGCN